MLTNKIRKLYNLKPIHSDWKKVRLKNTKFMNSELHYSVYIDSNNVLQKMVRSATEQDIYHIEVDYNVQLTPENEVIGGRGKKKNLSYAVVEKIKPSGCEFRYEQNLTFINHNNDFKYYIPYKRNSYSSTELETFLLEKFENPTPFEKGELHIYLNSIKEKKQRVKSGDIFRLRLYSGNFAYGRVISKVEKFKIQDVPSFGKYDAGWKGHSIFATPLANPTWIDWYTLITPDPNLKYDDLKNYKTTLSYLTNSALIVYNRFRVVDKTELDITSFDVPMDMDTVYNYTPFCHVFKWGAFVMTFPPNERLEELNELSFPKNYNPEGWQYDISIEKYIQSNIDGEVTFRFQTHFGDLRESIFKEKREIISKIIDYDIDKGEYDEFAKKYDCMTKEEIIQFCKD